MMIGLENSSRVIFGSPEPLKMKLNDPVKDNVKYAVHWAGHSTTLIQIYDKVFLLDPVFNDVISGVMLRSQKAAIDINKLSRLDMILVSHAHADHLSISTLDDIEAKFPGTDLIIPFGAEEFMPGYDLNIIRLKTGNSFKYNYTGQSKVIDSVKVTSVFASHFGGRFGFDSYLWYEEGCTGYIIEYKDITVFYAGDTIFDDKAFKYLGKKFNIDLAIIPIGPCKDCDEIDNFRHVTSYGALMMFDDLKAKYMLPVHYGAITYRSNSDYPVEVLKEIIKSKDSENQSSNGFGIYKDKVIILDEGGQFVFEYK
ncbi:MAG: hypothetical protein HGGPFJEG_00651 [Ignavibacteria bacterium]|nr:hypothetical protein [Ignavibacteria bacterium]